MRFGLALPHYDYSFPGPPKPVRFDDLAPVARRAEELGFDSVWVSDHFFLSLAKYGAGEHLYGSLEPFATLAALGRETVRVRLGTLVACAPFRPAPVVAHQAATIALWSQGRFELGLGAGWYEPEFARFGYRFGSTGERFAELERVAATVAGSVPLWIGAKGGPRALRVIAEHADGWNTAWRWTPEAYAALLPAFAAACDRAGRDPAAVRRSIGLFLLVGVDRHDLRRRWSHLQAWTPGGALDGVRLEEYAADTLSGTPERIREAIEAYEALGIEEVVVNPACMPFAVFDFEQIELFAAEVMRR